MHCIITNEYDLTGLLCRLPEMFVNRQSKKVWPIRHERYLWWPQPMIKSNFFSMKDRIHGAKIITRFKISPITIYDILNWNHFHLNFKSCSDCNGAVAIIRQSDSPTNVLNWWMFWKIILFPASTRKICSCSVHSYSWQQFNNNTNVQIYKDEKH